MSTKIEWTDETWNPVTGCTKVSHGCKNCYAERLAPRVFAGQQIGNLATGEHRPRVFTDVLMHHDRLDAPLHWKKPRRIFVNSMSDLFHEDVPDEFIDDVFARMALALQHTYQVLTKRPARMLAYVNGGAHLRMTRLFANFRAYTEPVGPWPLHNVWLGVSVEDQATADERIPLLLRTPAAVHFLSCEPLLGPIDLRQATYGQGLERPGPNMQARQLKNPISGLDWVISGGESGPKARPSHPDWFRSLRDQCAAAGVPYFFQQWGEWLHEDQAEAAQFAPEEEHLHDWPDKTASIRVGKKAAGRLLDGREHSEYPANW